MKTGDRVQLIGTKRQATITGVGSINIYYLFDDEAIESCLSIADFNSWFKDVIELSHNKLHGCDCGGYTTYKSFDDHYHSYWCNSQRLFK